MILQLNTMILMEQLKRQHDGYIVPFDIPSENLKKGDILRHKHGLGDDIFENIVVLNSSYWLPPEWVETWEKHYPEQTEETKPDYSKVIELIEGEIMGTEIDANNAHLAEEYTDYSELKCNLRLLKNLLTKIKAL